MKTTRAFLGACIVLTVSFLPTTAGAGATGDLRLFSISKSENRNQVIYAVRVDEACRPAGAAPVHAYWQNLEVGPSALSPLLWIEQPAYGVASQESSGSDPGDVRVRLRALPDRPIVVHTGRVGSACAATATATVASRPAALYNVYARLRRVFGVESVTISGRETGTGAIVQETVKR